LEVGVRELRSRLRAVLDIVEDGGEVTITERGKPVARLVGVSGPSMRERLIAEGVITPAKRPKRPSSEYPRVKIRGSLSDLVLEQRR
jgi:prevent-host-death family protein